MGSVSPSFPSFTRLPPNTAFTYKVKVLPYTLLLLKLLGGLNLQVIEACGLFTLFPLSLTNRNPLRMQFHEWVHLSSPWKSVFNSFSITVAGLLQSYANLTWIRL
jgi:hypothetical protein